MDDDWGYPQYPPFMEPYIFSISFDIYFYISAYVSVSSMANLTKPMVELSGFFYRGRPRRRASGAAAWIDVIVDERCIS